MSSYNEVLDNSFWFVLMTWYMSFSIISADDDFSRNLSLNLTVVVIPEAKCTYFTAYAFERNLDNTDRLEGARENKLEVHATL